MLAVLAAGMVSCSKDPVNTLNTGNFRDTAGTLKSVSDFPIGIAAEYGLMTGNASYAAVVLREASSVTFGNELKHQSVVQNDGSFNYATADNFYTLCAGAGIPVYGHTLCWYSQQNGTYLKGVAGAGSGSSVPNLVTNGGFEGPGNGKLFANWSVLNSSNGTFSAGTGANVHGGAASMQVVCVAGGQNYNTQIITDAITVTPGKTYLISYWVKAAAAGNIQFELRNNDGSNSVQYVGGQAATTGWTQITYPYAALNTTLQLAFDLGGNANTFYIDDVSIVDAAAAAAAAPTAVAQRVDSVLKLWVTSAVTHYAGKIKAWDVVNEPMADGSGALRTSSNTTIPTPAPTNWFFWADYLGRSYALKAFQYAKAADPAALLFINEYNLESSNAKLDSLIAYVKELKTAGAPIDGIGTQMHISLATTYTGIDNAFIKLAATGLKVRVSELDVRVNPTNKTGFNALPVDPTLKAFQADMYKYVVSSYIKNVPSAQRYGITVWGVNDGTSWIITSQKNADAPLLFDDNFSKKPAYAGFLQGLKTK